MLDNWRLALVEKRHPELFGKQFAFHYGVFGQHVRCRHELMA